MDPTASLRRALGISSFVYNALYASIDTRIHARVCVRACAHIRVNFVMGVYMTIRR